MVLILIVINECYLFCFINNFVLYMSVHKTTPDTFTLYHV